MVFDVEKVNSLSHTGLLLDPIFREVGPLVVRAKPTLYVVARNKDDLFNRSGIVKSLLLEQI